MGQIALRRPRYARAVLRKLPESRSGRLTLVGATFAACLGLLILWAWQRTAPFVHQDEHVYGVLARSVGTGEGYSYQDLPVTAFKTLWPVLSAPAWAIFDGESAWRAAQAINGFLWALTLLPAYALARRLASFWPALGIATAATLAPAAVWAGQLMTEAMAYPLATTALLCAVRLLEQPSMARGAIALAVAAAAGTARTQLLVMVPVVLLAVALDVVRHDSGWRARLRSHRLVATAAAVVVVVGLGLLLTGRTSGLLGTYAGTTEAVDLSELARYMVKYTAVIATAVALLPFVVLVSLVVRRESWSDDHLAPMLCVAVAAVAIFWVNGAWASASLSPELRERYVFYPLPVVMALLPAVIDRIRPIVLAAVTAAVALYLLPVLPGLYGSAGEEFIQYKVNHVLLKLGLGDGGAVGRINVWAVAVVSLAAALLIGLRLRPRISMPLLVAAAIVPTMVMQFGILFVRERDANATSASFAAAYPEPGDFVDARVRGDAAFIRTPGTRQLARFHFELANTKLRRTWRAPRTDEFNGLGADCPLEADGRGILRPDRNWASAAADPKRPCSGAALARYLLFDDAARTVVIANGRLLFAEGPTRLYEVPPGVAPRLRYGPPPPL